MTQQDLLINVGVNDEKLIRLIGEVNTLGKSFIGAANATKPLDAQLRALGRRSTEFGRYFTRNVTTPLLIATGIAAKMGYEFDKTLSRIQTLGGGANESIESLRKQVLGLSGSTMTDGPKALAEALYFIRSSGIAAADSMEVLKAVNIGAQIGMGDTKTVADAVTSAMNAYGQKTVSAAKAVDIFQATVEAGKAEPAALARSIGAVIPIAAQMGVKLQEVGGIVAQLSLSGLSAQQAVTGLRATLVTFARGQPIVRKGLLAIGLSLEDVQSMIKTSGLVPTLNEIRKRIDAFGKSGGQFPAALSKAIGVEGMRKLRREVGLTSTSLASAIFPNVRALTAFRSTTANMQQTANTLGHVRDSAGAAQAKFELIRKQNWAQFHETVGKLNTEITKLGVQVLPLFTDALKAGLALIKVFQFNWLGPFKGLKPVLVSITATLAVMLALIGPLTIALGLLLRGASVYVLFRERAAAKLLAAQAAETAAIDATTAAIVAETAAVDGLAIAQARAARGAAATFAGFGGTTLVKDPKTGRFMKQAGAPTLFGGGSPMRDPKTGRFMKVAAEDAALAAKNVGRLGAAMVGLRGIIATVGTALRVAFAWAWPLLVIEATFQIYQNWDKIAGAIYKADQNLHSFVNRHAGGGFLKGIKDVYEKLPKALREGFVGALPQPIVAGAHLLGELAKKGKEAAGSAKKVTDETAKAVPYAVQFARAHGITVQQARMILNIFKGTNAELRKAKDAVNEAFGRLQGDLITNFQAGTEAMLTSFDETTDKMVKNLRVKVKVLNKTFVLGPNDLTPAERELKALEKADDLRQARRDIQSGREELATAMLIGDPGAVREAQQKIQDAQTEISKSNLQTRAGIERKAADDATQAAVDALQKRRGKQRTELQAERDLEQRHLEDRLASLVDQLEKRRITLATFNKKLKGLMAAYGVTASDGARLVGKAFGDQITESLQGLEKVFRTNFNLIGNHMKDAATIADATAKAFKKAATAMEKALKAMADATDTLHGLVPGGTGSNTPYKGLPGKGLIFPLLGATATHPVIQGPGGRFGASQGTHNQSDWQSANAVDIKATKNTPVLSPVTGVVVKVSGGPGTRHVGTKILIGYGITIKGPDATYYIAHIENVPFPTGEQRTPVKRGQQIGTVDPTAGHIHFAVDHGNPAGIYAGTPTAAAATTQTRSTASATPATASRSLASAGGLAAYSAGNLIPAKTRGMTRELASKMVAYSRLVQGGHFTRKQLFAALPGSIGKMLQRRLSPAEKRRLGPAGIAALHEKLAGIQGSPLQYGLIRQHPQGPLTLGPAGRTGIVSGGVTINVFESGNPKRTAVVIRNELQKHAARNASSPRGKTPNKKVGLA